MQVPDERIAPLVARVTALETLHRIQTQVPSGLEVYMDEDQLEHALINLSRNAVEALQAAQGRVSIVARSRHGDLVVEVIDEGCGVANKVAVWALFFRGRLPRPTEEHSLWKIVRMRRALLRLWRFLVPRE